MSTFLDEGLPLGGFWTSVIASGIQALEVFRLRQFDIVVIDAALQSFGAMEFIRRLRGVSDRTNSSEPRTLAPVIIISEDPIEISDTDREQLGISLALHAPLEIEDVARDLHEVFLNWREANPDQPMSDAQAQ
ncbi:MAG TPA: hypothetical protein VNZ58_09440 [Thermomicrobiales bacterium]|nr:hypothetical protein [Thermomicrobiales bacterium]